MIRRFLAAISIFIAFVSCERDVFTGYEDKPADENCKVFIESDPSKASIFLNGINTGKTTPDTLTWLKPGVNKITLKTTYYDDTTATVELEQNKTSRLFINFEANSRSFGKINCTSFPDGAEIFFDGVYTNSKTPYTIKSVKPGVHSVKFRYASRRDDSVSVNVSAGILSTASIVLEDTTKWISYNTKNSPILSNTINSIAIDKKNSIWFGTDKGLSKKSGNRWTNYTTTNISLPTNTINHVAIDHSDGVWLSTPKGVYLFRNSMLTDYSYNLANKNIKMIACSPKDTIWASVEGVGLCKLSGNKWIIYNTINSGLKDKNISCMIADDYENVWIGSLSYGLTLFNRFEWTTFRNSPTGICSIHISKSDTMWVGTNRYPYDYGPVFYDNGEEWKMLIEPKLISSITYSICSSDRRVFFGSAAGLGIYSDDTEKVTFYTEANSAFLLFRIQTLAVDALGNLWIGTAINGSGMFKKENL
jgi:ligand-binding sensor domain-containing protein